MSSLGSYQRFQEENNGTLHDTVQMKIEADTVEERLECLHDLVLLHEMLEQNGVFKKVSE